MQSLSGQDIDKLTLEAFDAGCDDSRKRLLWAVRAGLIAADAAASGLFREAKDMGVARGAIRERLKTCDAAYIRQGDHRQSHQATRRRVGKAGISSRTAPPFNPHALAARAVWVGKTLAAWRWIEEQTRLRPVKRVIFLYPTRATATEGFKDYVAWAPEADAGLIHGTAAYELDGMFANPAKARPAQGQGLWR